MKSGQVIDSLRELGFEVHVRHSRPIEGHVVYGRDELMRTVVARLHCVPKYRLPKGARHALRGGYTDVTVATPRGEQVIATATTRWDEPFNRQVGLSVALGRALKALDVDPEELDRRLRTFRDAMARVQTSGPSA